MYAVMYRTPGGSNVVMKARYKTLDDAESCVVECTRWISEDQWQRGQDSSIFNLSDGSCFVIYSE